MSLENALHRGGSNERLRTRIATLELRFRRYLLLQVELRAFLDLDAQEIMRPEGRGRHDALSHVRVDQARKPAISPVPEIATNHCSHFYY